MYGNDAIRVLLCPALVISCLFAAVSLAAEAGRDGRQGLQPRRNEWRVYWYGGTDTVTEDCCGNRQPPSSKFNRIPLFPHGVEKEDRILWRVEDLNNPGFFVYKWGRRKMAATSLRKEAEEAQREERAWLLAYLSSLLPDTAAQPAPDLHG